MKPQTAILVGLNLLVFSLGIGLYVHKGKLPEPPPAIVQPQPDSTVTPIPPDPVKPPISFTISSPRPSYMNYAATVAKLKEWNSQAPELTEVGTYGKTSRGQDIYYLRICDKRSTAQKPKVLLTACIHGNEPLASSTVMWWAGTMLESYSKDEAVRKLLDERDIYIVPVVSPDSYPSSRHVDGVDPNRDFPGPSRPNHQSKAPVAALQGFFLKIRPNAVISGHTWGRVYLTPYGDKMANPENKDEYDRIVGQMKTLSGYRMIRACDMYGPGGGLNNPPIRGGVSEHDGEEATQCDCMCRHMGVDGKYGSPIYGSEVDWYYRNKAFAIVMEFGTHQRIPSDADTKTEFDMTYKAALHFVKEAPLVEVRSSAYTAGWDDRPSVSDQWKPKAMPKAGIKEYSSRREE